VLCARATRLFKLVRADFGVVVQISYFLDGSFSVLLALIWLFIPEVKGHNVVGKKPLGEVFKELISTYILFARCVIASPSLILSLVSCFGIGCSCER